MKKQSILVIIVFAIFLLTSCGVNSGNGDGALQTPETPITDETPKTPETLEASAGLQTDGSSEQPLVTKTPDNEPEPEVLTEEKQLLAGMTLEEKIGQLFIIRPDALQIALEPDKPYKGNVNGAVSLDEQMKDVLEKYPVGGVALFSKNILTPEQVTEFIGAMQQTSVIPLFVGVDEEGGSVSRIANTKAFSVPRFSDMKEIGRSADPNKAYEIGLTIGSYLHQYGFNLDFAPVADMNTNPNNTVIGKRAFGSDTDLVSLMVAAEIKGFHEAGIMTSVKHFPGHGDTKGDTHNGSVSVEKTWEELWANELIPFQKAIETGVDMVMISHITTPNITSDGLPSSLSYEMVTGRLRGEMKFDGVVITDSMSMGAIIDVYSSGESAVKAILAGVDIILMPEDFVAAYNGVYDAVKSGVLSEERINESVLRILALKVQYLY